MSDPAGTTEYSYDRRGMLRKEQRTLHSGAADAVTTYTYDASGDRNRIGFGSTYPLR